MNVRVEGTGGGGQEIKLEYNSVMSELGKAREKLLALTLPSPNEGSLGRNQLNYTDVWLERELNLNAILEIYIEAVNKNIEDTEANVTMLRDQDEAIQRQ